MIRQWRTWQRVVSRKLVDLFVYDDCTRIRCGDRVWTWIDMCDMDGHGWGELDPMWDVSRSPATDQVNEQRDQGDHDRKQNKEDSEPKSE